MQHTLARALAHPDKAKRDKIITTLHTYIAGNDFNDYEMMKLWKALHYCLWLSDKAAVQLELAQNLANMIHSCKTDAQAMQYMRCFLQTIMREWGALDYHRINKFYSMIRLFLRETFRYMYVRQWNPTIVTAMLDILQHEMLNKSPNGPRMHVADIFLSEVYIATSTSAAHATNAMATESSGSSKNKKNKEGKKAANVSSHLTGVSSITDSVMDLLLVPWLIAAKNERDHVYRERVLKAVFAEYTVTFARELNKTAAAESSSQSGGRKKAKTNEHADASSSSEVVTVFSAVDTRHLQALVFASASAQDVGALQRKGLYAIHESLQAVTKVQFVQQEFAAKVNIGSVVPVSASDKKNTNKGGKVVVTAAPAAHLSSDEDEEEEEAGSDDDSMEYDEEEEEEVGDESEEGWVNINSESGSDESESESESESEEEEEEEKVAEEPVGKKRKSNKSTHVSTPVAVKLKSATSILMKTATPTSTPVKVADNTADKSPKAFLSSPTFAGAKSGYVFKKGSEGVGYYTDAKEVAKAVKQDKNKNKSNPNTPKQSTHGSGSASGYKKGVTFGENINKDYDASVQALKSTKSPEAAKHIAPKKGAIKKK